MNYNEYFNKIGYELIDSNAQITQPTVGIKTSVQEGKTIVKVVDRDSGAWIAGLNVNDEIIAINNHRLEENGKVMDYFLSMSSIGDNLTFLIARDGIIHTIKVPVLKSDKKNYHIERRQQATTDEIKLGNLWLSL